MFFLFEEKKKQKALNWQNKLTTKRFDGSWSLFVMFGSSAFFFIVVCLPLILSGKKMHESREWVACTSLISVLVKDSSLHNCSYRTCTSSGTSVSPNSKSLCYADSSYTFPLVFLHDSVSVWRELFPWEKTVSREKTDFHEEQEEVDKVLQLHPVLLQLHRGKKIFSMLQYLLRSGISLCCAV